MAIQDFIGKGLTFPVEISSKGVPVLYGGLDLVRSSIKMILGWNGDRIFLSEFYSRINDLLEEPNDEILARLVEYLINEQLTKWEKRIRLLDISAEVYSAERLDVTIKYQITNTQIQDVMTYPFYRTINH
jgi:phage baseplate assembly protein W